MNKNIKQSLEENIEQDLINFEKDIINIDIINYIENKKKKQEIKIKMKEFENNLNINNNFNIEINKELYNNLLNEYKKLKFLTLDYKVLYNIKLNKNEAKRYNELKYSFGFKR